MKLSERLRCINKGRFETDLTKRIQEIFSEKDCKETKETLCKILLFIWTEVSIVNLAGHLQDMRDILSEHGFSRKEIVKILQSNDTVTPEIEKEIASIAIDQGGLNTEWSQLPNLSSLAKRTPLSGGEPYERFQS